MDLSFTKERGKCTSNIDLEYWILGQYVVGRNNQHSMSIFNIQSFQRLVIDKIKTSKKIRQLSILKSKKTMRMCITRCRNCVKHRPQKFGNGSIDNVNLMYNWEANIRQKIKATQRKHRVSKLYSLRHIRKTNLVLSAFYNSLLRTTTWPPSLL